MVTWAQATRIVFSSKHAAGGPVKAKAVEFVDAQDPTKKLVAVRLLLVSALRARLTSTLQRVADEVILCGGTFNTPQLLELSGIGNAHHLQQSASSERSISSRLRH